MRAKHLSRFYDLNDLNSYFFNFNREIGVTKGFLIKFNLGFGIRVSSHGKFLKMGVSARHPVFVESLWVHFMEILKK